MTEETLRQAFKEMIKAGRLRPNGSDPCQHCWHPHTGPIHVVLKSGQIVLSCCSCPAMKVEHRDHWRMGLTR